MADRQVPGPVQANPERIQSRPYPEFATFPPEELLGDDVRAGRDAAVAGRTTWPPVLIVVGFLLTFTTFVFNNPIPLIVGLLVILVGSVWSAAAHRSAHGVGPVTIREQR